MRSYTLRERNKQPMSDEKDDTAPHITWLMLTCQDSNGAMSVVEIPRGNHVDFEMICTDKENAGIDITNYLNRPPNSRGIKITIHAVTGVESEPLIRFYPPR